MNPSTFILFIMAYVIGHFFGQMSIKEDIKKQGIAYKSTTKNLFYTILEYSINFFKTKPKSVNPPNQNQQNNLNNYNNNINNYKDYNSFKK